MDLKVNYKSEVVDDYIISVGGQTKTINDAFQSVTFDLQENKEYTLEITKLPEKSDFTLRNILLFLLMMIPFGVIIIILMDTDNAWWEEAAPLSFKAKLNVNLKENTEINFKFKNAKYDKALNLWSKPCLETNFDGEISTVYEKKEISINNALFSFAKKMTSIWAVSSVFFLVILILAAVKGNYTAVIAFGAVIAALTAIVALTILFQRKTAKKMLAALN